MVWKLFESIAWTAQGAELIDSVMDVVRKEAESCDCLQGEAHTTVQRLCRHCFHSIHLGYLRSQMLLSVGQGFTLRVLVAGIVCGICIRVWSSGVIQLLA